MKGEEGNLPACGFLMRVPAQQAPEPTGDAPGQTQIGGIDAEDPAPFDDDGEQPVGHDDRQAAVGPGPSLDPTESRRRRQARANARAG